MTDSPQPNGPGSCLGRTCLQWSADGELTAVDLSLVMARLAQVDQEVAALNHQLDPRLQPSPAIS